MDVSWSLSPPTSRDKNRLGFMEVSGRAGRERDQHVGTSPPEVPDQNDKEIQLKAKYCNLTLSLD